MLNYYGANCESLLNENCTHAFATEYNSDTYKELKLKTNNKIKIITPDWIIDSIDACQLVDETIYDTRCLITNAENENLLKIKSNNDAEVESNDEKKLSSSDLNSLDSETLTKQAIKMRNYVLPTENFFNQISSGESASFKDDEQKEAQTLQQQISINSETADSSNAAQTPNSKSKAKKSRSRFGNTNQAINNNKNDQTKAKQTNSATGTTSSSTFNFDMNEIFQSVIGDAINKSIKKPKPILQILSESKFDSPNDYNPYLEDDDEDNVKNTSNTTTPNNKSQHNTSFSLYNETYCTQENSHLIKFNNCLLGCVFYLNDFEIAYTKDTLNEWQKSIEKYGGVVVNDYEASSDQITHVLCANRFTNTYKQALKDNKRIITQFWLEDVLEEEKMRPPWRAYHFPALFERQNGPLKNHVTSI